MITPSFKRIANLSSHSEFKPSAWHLLKKLLKIFHAYWWDSSQHKWKNVSTSVVFIDMSPRLTNSSLGRKHRTFQCTHFLMTLLRLYHRLTQAIAARLRLLVCVPLCTYACIQRGVHDALSQLTLWPWPLDITSWMFENHNFSFTNISVYQNVKKIYNWPYTVSKISET